MPDTSDTERTSGATLVAPSAGTPEESWLRTGDLGVSSDGELLIVGRIEDLLTVYGRDQSPDDRGDGEGYHPETVRGNLASGTS